MKSYFGIDFGTTNTAVARLLVDNDYGTKIVNISENGLPFSSMIAINKKDGKVLCGRQVKIKRQQLSRDYYIFSSFKSELDSDKVFNIAGKIFTATDIVALFLKSIKNYINSNTGLDIEEATFAIPIDFTPIQRRELKKASLAAGIKVNKFISESTAAYMQNIAALKGMSTIAVFDWGGGTLDISILEIEKGVLSELAVHGKRLGGDHIDKMLAKKVHADVAAKSNIGDYEDMPDKEKDDIIAKCEGLKIDLSSDDFSRFQLIDYGMPGSVQVGLEIERFKEIIQPQIGEALETLCEAIKKAKISVAQLDAILMVGGSCEMIPIQEIMTELFERKNIKIIYPENMQWSVAVGAAMIGTSNTEYRLSHSVGVLLSDDSFFPIIKKDTAVPCEINELRFGVVEETTDAHFIITDENSNKLEVVNVPVKGFTAEGISLNADIDNDMIANITIQSSHMGYKQKIEINKLGFYYDLNEIRKYKETGMSGKIASFPSRDPKTCSYIGCIDKATRGGYCDYHYSYEYADSK
ncbi:MAG: Hsp70 family protein [Tissierellia bacterium]|nr:Hsp70 family protein [Tissierellia bacterium]